MKTMPVPTVLRPGDIVIIEDISPRDAFFHDRDKFINTFWMLTETTTPIRHPGGYVSLCAVPLWPSHEDYHMNFHVPLTFFAVRVMTT